MGTSGAFRANSLDASAMGSMQSHELRLDLAGKKRRVRDVEPLIYSPHGSDLDLKQSYEAHVKGAARNKGARSLCLHAFIQFPTDLKMTPETEKLMLAEATKFVDLHHGGNAVFRARLDRDEAGRHGVDVFYAPRYDKKTAKGTDEWISLTKFGKELAIARFGERPKKDKKTEAPVLDKNGKPVMVKNDNSYFQGQALQDLWFLHLRDEMKLDWVQRGEKKLGRDPDRLEPEAFKIKQELKKLDKQREADIADAIERNKMVERTAELAEVARKKLMDTAKDKATEAEKRAVEAEARVRAADAALEAAKEAQRAAQEAADAISAKAQEEAARLREERTKLEQDQMRFEEAKDKSAADLAKTLAWVERGASNLLVSINLVQDGTYDTELSLKDMPDQPKKFEALQNAAPDKKPTMGFRARFWSLNFSDGSGPAPLPEKIRAALTKAFDRVATWASEMRQSRLDAATATEAANALKATAKMEAEQILKDARIKGDELASVDVGIKSYATVHELMKQTIKSVFGDDGYEQIAAPVRKAWAAHPDNPERVAPPTNFSGLDR